MIDLAAAKLALEKAPANAPVGVVSKAWLEEVVRDLSELADIRKGKAVLG